MIEKAVRPAVQGPRAKAITPASGGPRSGRYARLVVVPFAALNVLLGACSHQRNPDGAAQSSSSVSADISAASGTQPMPDATSAIQSPAHLRGQTGATALRADPNQMAAEQAAAAPLVPPVVHAAN